MPICSKVEPPLIPIRGNHFVACHLYPTPEGGAREAAAAAAPSGTPHPVDPALPAA